MKLQDLTRFLFGREYFSWAKYEMEVEQLARDAGSRPCRGNTSAQDKRFVMAEQIEKEARLPI
ncbi:MAG: hypothetical protein GC203_05315 [Phenylobacterium sp.]|uniref:hypothetical protein n=1 Tax=Phenylobacterium sp. TaxID=1871053 RepID=UPI0025CDCF1C|nr:hypothetical protein [Phenylobacterium sp.]MBI1197263.1 hypothetical protein [Phenylobacterium sp.]